MEHRNENTPVTEAGENTETVNEWDESEALVLLAKALLDNEDFVMRYAVGNPIVERAVVGAYLRGGKKSAPISPAGSASFAPKIRAKTLDEAKKLCESYLAGL